MATFTYGPYRVRAATEGVAKVAIVVTIAMADGLPAARAAANDLVDDKDTRADIDALGAALGVDTTKGKKADALKALRSFDDTGNLGSRR